MNTIKHFCIAVLLAVSSPAAAESVRFHTNHGVFELSIDAQRAPQTAANFLQYARDGFFDGLIFHRVIPGFMIQGGGFTPDLRQKPTREAIANEADNGLKNVKYSVAMARTPAPHSATAQFFINIKDNAFLDFKSKTRKGWGYTVFGKVTKGFETIDKIAAVPTGPAGPFAKDAPQTPVLIKKAVVVETP